MMKHITSSALFLCVLLTVVPYAFAEAQPSPDHFERIQGKVLFEKRFVRSGDFRSDEYLSVVLESSEGKYLLDERFHPTSPKNPESMIYQVSEGTLVEAEGVIERLRPGFSIVTNLQYVKVLKATGLDLGWICRNALSSDPSLNVRIWNTPQPMKQSSSFKIRIQQIIGRAVYDIAFVDPAFLVSQEDHLVYSGSAEVGDVEVQINKIQIERGLQYTGSVTIPKGSSKTQSVEFAKIPLVCSLARNVPMNF